MSFVQMIDGKKMLDWDKTEAYAKNLTIPELRWAIKDCLECVMDEGFYQDQASVYSKELRRKEELEAKKKKPVEKIYEYTVNVDIQVFARDTLDATRQLGEIIKARYWLGGVQQHNLQ